MTGATSHAERRGWCEWHGSLLHMSCSVAHTRAVHTDGLLMHTVLFWFEPLADVYYLWQIELKQPIKK